MALLEVSVTRWSGNSRPTEAVLRSLLSEQGLSPYLWSNGPSDTYARHSHSYDKVIYVVAGSIVFDLGARGEIELDLGDRLDLPKCIEHSARVGPDGVTCLEAHSQ